MRRRTIEGFVLCLALCVAGWLVALVNAEDESEERVSWEQLPAAIQKNLSEHASDVTEIEKDLENGKVVYEVAVEVDGKETEFTYDAEGKVLEIEEEITLAEAPAPVRTVILALAFGGKVEEISRETEAGRVAYEAEIERKDVNLELLMDAQGNVLEIEVKGKGGDEDEDEETLSWDQIPAPVQRAIKEHAGDAKIEKIEKESEGGKLVYEAEFKTEGRETELKIAPDGTLLGMEQEISLDQAPEAVRGAIERQVGGAKITEIELETEGGKTTYEVEFTRNGKEYELQIDPNGKILKLEEEEDDDDDDEEDEEDEQVISWEKVPAVVQAVIKRHAGNAKIGEVEVETEDGKLVYEAKFVKDSKQYELEVDADGNVVEFEEDED